MEKTTWYAVVGNDGMRPVVWGIGETPEDAQEDARDWADKDVEEMRVEKITRRQAAVVEAGDVSWPIVVLEVR